MKEFLKILLLIIINVFTAFVVIVMIFTFNLGKIVNNFTKNIVEDAISEVSKKIEKESNKLTNIKNEKDENNNDLKELANKYIDIIANGITTGEIKKYNLKEDIITYLKNHKSEINKKYKIKITDEVIQEIINIIDIDKVQHEVDKFIININNGIDLPILKEFTFMGSLIYKIICIVIFFICIVLNAVILKSSYKWLLPIGTDLIIAGSISAFVSIILNVIIQLIIKIINNTTINNITMQLFINVSFIILCLGIIMLIINSILEKRFRDSKKIVDKLETSE